MYNYFKKTSADTISNVDRLKYFVYIFQDKFEKIDEYEIMVLTMNDMVFVRHLWNFNIVLLILRNLF